MPQLGESVESGTISRWLKRDGDAVRVDEPLFEVSSDKVTMEIPSLVAGTLEILVPEGEQAAVGAVVARVGSGAAPGAGKRKISPVVRRMAERRTVNLESVAGSGEGGRVTKRDLLTFLAHETQGFERLSPMRRTIAASLGPAQKNAINVVSVVELDMEAIAQERARRGLTYLPFLAHAIVESLAAFPALNASISDDGSEVARHASVHLGVAVDLDEE